MITDSKPSDGASTPVDTTERKAPKRKRRGCLLKLFLIALITLPVLAFLVNGPIFRWAAEYGIKKGAESIGLTGSVNIRGTLLSGLDIEKANFTGDGSGPVEMLQIGNAGVDYSILDLIRHGGLGWIEEIRLSDANVDVTLAESSKEDADITEEAEAKEEPGSDEPSVLWQLLETRYALENINLRVTQGEKTYQVDNFTLILSDGGEGKLSIAQLKIPGAEPRKGIATDIEVTPTSLSLGPLRILDAVEITELTLKQVSKNEPFLTATLGLSGGSVEASYSAGGNIAVNLANGAISLPELLALAQVEGLESGEIKKLGIQFTGDFGAPATWDSDIAIGISDVKWGTARADEITLSSQLNPGDNEGDRLKLTVNHDGTSFEATAAAGLSDAETPADLASIPLSVSGDLNVAAVERVLAEYLPEDSPPIPAEGSLSGSFSAEIKEKQIVVAHVDLASETLSYDGVDVDSLKLIADLESPDSLALDAGFALDEQTTFGINGKLDPSTLIYSGKADLEAAMTGRLKTLLAKLGVEKEIEAAAVVKWAGGGNLKENTHKGRPEIHAKGVRLAGAESFDADLVGSYDNLDIELTTLSVSSETLQLNSPVSYRDLVLKLPGLKLRSGDLVLLEGTIESPLDPAALKTPAGYFTQEGEVDINVKSDKLALESILGLFQEKPPVNCVIDLSLVASGPPSGLGLEGAITAENITIPDKDIPPARVELDLAVNDAVATLTGLVEQPQIRPFTLEGSIPFAPAAWVDGARDPMTEPVSFAAKMQESQLAFLAAYTTAIDRILGSVDIDLALSGTLNQPTVVGTADLRVDTLRFANANAPSARNIVADLRFEEQVLHIDKLQAVLAGGQIGMGGSIGFPKGAHPDFDLRLGGHEVLVVRGDGLSVRTNLDLSLKGPFDSAALSGTIGVTNSLFYKDIDLLPIGGVGRGGGKSALPVVESAPKMPLPKSLDVGVPIEPFRDWAVDLRIVTAAPFRVAGNVAQAEALCDLSIGGTLGKPVPTGRIWLPKGRVTLPFSKIDFSEAEVRFDEITGFNGALAMRANSKSGDYRVSIYAQNRLLNPEVVFTCIPPLPREDILTLLASGVTREQLTDGGGTAATKAFIYWLKSLSNKEGKIDPDAPPTFAETLEERTEVSIGKANVETGEMGINASIRLWRQSYLAFSLGKEGSQRGVLKYVFRFR